MSLHECTYHFKNLRLNISPQMRIHSQNNTPGFLSFLDCERFCESIGFGYTIYYIDENGKSINCFLVEK